MLLLFLRTFSLSVTLSSHPEAAEADVLPPPPPTQAELDAAWGDGEAKHSTHIMHISEYLSDSVFNHSQMYC